MNEKKKITPLKITIGIIIAVFSAIVFFALVNTFIRFGLRSYIKTFSQPEYVSQLEPVLEDERYVFYTNNDLNIIELSDLHLGCGFLSYKKDRKTIKEIITIIQNEKPDLLVINGDAIYPGFLKSGTINNLSETNVLLYLLDYMGVYYTINFGGSDSGILSLGDVKALSNKIAMHDSKYNIFNPELLDYGYSNQCIVVKKTDQSISKLIFLLDSNEEYLNNKDLKARNYKGIIYDEQVDWAADLIKSYTKANDEALNITNQDNEQIVKSIVFTHLPIGEFEIAFDDLYHNDFNETIKSRYITGVWGEKFDENNHKDLIEYSGHDSGIEIGKEDKLYEILYVDLKSLEAVFTGGDHLNNVVTAYNGVYFSENYSIDNYSLWGIKNYSKQRGCTLIKISELHSLEIIPKNLYTQNYNTENGELNAGTHATDYYNKTCLPQE